VTLSPNVGFELKTVVIPIASTTARGTLTAEARKSRKYRQTAASIAHIGLEEPPLIISPARDGIYLLLDGAIQLDILKERNEWRFNTSYPPTMRGIPTTSASTNFPNRS
jgi:hypothetical protein